MVLEVDLAFTHLKIALTFTPVLALPNLSKRFTIETGAFGFAIDAIIMQEGKLIAYFSKSFPPTVRSASTYAKELMAIVEEVKKWRHYVFGTVFTISIEHNSLKHLMSQTIHTTDQQKFIWNLMGYNYHVVYRKWRDNQVADTLSRMEESNLLSISSPRSDIL